MNTQNLTSFIKTVQNGIVKHSPEILTAVGIGGMITTTILAVKATPKALKQIEEKKEKEQVDKLTVVETVKTAYKPYIPAAVTGVASAACLIGAQSINLRRNAALVAAYQISTTALNEYKEATEEIVGEEKVKEIKEKVAEKQIQRNPVSTATVVEPTNQIPNVYLCYDAGGNHYFRSNRNKIEEAINHLNWELSHNAPYVALNELYDYLDVQGTELGDTIGWNLYRDQLIEPYFTEKLANTGEPCLVIGYSNPPKYGYQDSY